MTDASRRLLAGTAALAALPVSYLWTIVVAMIFPGWVGASHKPIPVAMCLAYAPPVLAVAAGIRALRGGGEGRSPWTIVAGVLAIVTGLASACLVVFAIAMLSIG
jgi:hypothetical protein